MSRRDPFKENEKYFRKLEENMPDPIRMMFDPTYEPEMRDDPSELAQSETRSAEQVHDPEKPAEERDASELGGLRVGGEAVNERSDDHHEQRPDDDDHPGMVLTFDDRGHGTIRLGGVTGPTGPTGAATPIQGVVGPLDPNRRRGGC